MNRKKKQFKSFEFVFFLLTTDYWLLATDLIIYCLIRQGVLFLVHCPWQVLYLNAADLCNQFLGPGMQQLQSFVLHFVAAFDLLDEQLGVREQLDARRAEFDGLLQSRDRGGIFGNVAGGRPQILRDPFKHARPGITGIVARCAVAVDSEFSYTCSMHE